VRASVSLGRWFGVPVGHHYSWFIIAWLITLSLTSQFAAINRAWSPSTVWGLSILTAVLFFVCIVLHELQAYYLQSQLSASLRDIRVADVKARDCATVDAKTSLRRFVDEQLLRMVSRCVAVTEDGRVIGLITPDEVKHVERERWERTSVSQVMRPLQTLHPVKPDASAGDALELMGRENITQLPVVSDGHLEGVVTRSYLVHVWQIRRELAA
jgi:CBS domain-containing protein